jgi:pyruvate/2-oxoglutarate/acetoin dehydrogenase E1 component
MPITEKIESAGPMVSTKYRVAIRDALLEEMTRDPNVLLMGQDIGVSNGLFRLTEGLFERFGPERVRDTPISETATVGAAIGLAMLGYRPVLEIAFSDLILTCFDSVVNQLAKIPFMFGTQGRELPVVIRALTGAGLGVGAHHSQSLEALFAHMPGLNVLAPATARDAKALLKAAIRGKKPTIFLEHKMLLRDSDPVPALDEVGEVGRASIPVPGTDITIVSYSATRKTAMQAANELQREGISAEVIDLRSIAPMDTDAVVQSVRKTGRLVVVQEAYEPFGVGAEVLARVSSYAFDALKAPMLRVAVPFVPVPANKTLETAYLPSPAQVVAAARRTVFGGGDRCLHHQEQQ